MTTRKRDAAVTQGDGPADVPPRAEMGLPVRVAPSDAAPGPADSGAVAPSRVNAERGEAAIRLHQEAVEIAGTPPVDFCSRVLQPLEVRTKREAAVELLKPGPLVIGAGEAVPALGSHEPATDVRHHLVDTLERPTTITARASEKRLELLDQLGLLQAGLDTAQTAKAQNAIEKMLCHQLVGAHSAAMNLLAFIPGLDSRRGVAPLPPSEIARLGNTAARLMDAFAAGSEALRKLKSGGTQRVVVQHQQLVVAESGAGVVIAERKPKRHRGAPRAERRARKNDR